jgi:hypothetical protein
MPASSTLEYYDTTFAVDPPLAKGLIKNIGYLSIKKAQILFGKPSSGKLPLYFQLGPQW